jgi:hypothetical protein
MAEGIGLVFPIHIAGAGSGSVITMPGVLVVLFGYIPVRHVLLAKWMCGKIKIALLVREIFLSGL